MRYTSPQPSVEEARDPSRGRCCSSSCILLGAAYAAFSKLEVYTNIIGET